MSRDAVDALLSYIKVDQAAPVHHWARADAPPVVTIARDHGAGGEAIATAVAERLEVACFDKTLLDAAVKGAKADPALMHRLDEELPPRPGTGLYAAYMGLSDPLAEYQKLMHRVVSGIAFRGGVIVGRGAHLLIHRPPFLRVRIVGSEEACAKRLAAGGDAAFETRLAEVRSVNAERTKYIRQCFGVDADDPKNYDLVINTDRFPKLERVVDLIVQAVAAQAA